MERTELLELASDAAARANFGKASARKTGRNRSWPYVPVIIVGDERTTHEHQIRSVAFATRQEAVSCAQRTIDRQRALLAEQLLDPRYRALREHYGLPREINP